MAEVIEKLVAHTPGPWITRPDGFNPECIEVTTSERVSEGFVPIATVETGWEGPIEDEQQASLRLIVAAPEMHADGKFLLDRLEEFERELLDDEVARQFMGHVSPAISRFRAALAKAAQS